MSESVIKCVIENSILDNFSNIATIIISAVNLFFVIKFYMNDKVDHKLEKIQNHKYEWYKMIDVQKRVKNLNQLSEKIREYYLNLLQSNEDSTEKRTVMMGYYIKEIDNIFLLEKSNFSYLLKSIDKNYNAELSVLYNEYQEEYMNILIIAKAKEEIDISNLYNIESKISDKYYNICLELIK